MLGILAHKKIWSYYYSRFVLIDLTIFGLVLVSDAIRYRI